MLGLLTAGVLLGAGAVAAVRTSGYTVTRPLAGLTPWQFTVIEHAARRIVVPDREGVPGADDIDVAGFVDGYAARMPAPMLRDLGRLLAYLEHLAPLRSGKTARFTRLSAADQDEVLAAMESAGEGMLRGGFEALKSLVFMGYYRDARTWKILGYEGPIVGR
jgi:hypothetical protein